MGRASYVPIDQRMHPLEEVRKTAENTARILNEREHFSQNSGVPRPALSYANGIQGGRRCAGLLYNSRRRVSFDIHHDPTRG